MSGEQINKEIKKDNSDEPSLKKMIKKDQTDNAKITNKGSHANGQQSEKDEQEKDNRKNEESSSSDCIVLKHKSTLNPTSQNTVNTIAQQQSQSQQQKQQADQEDDHIGEEDDEDNDEDEDDDVQIISVKSATNPSAGIPKRKDSNSATNNSKQKKKNTNRCKICKKGGSSQSLKPCKDCGRLFHFQCINMKKEESHLKKYVCDLCKDKQKQKKAVEREKEKKKKIKEKEKEKEKQLKIESILAEAKKKLEKPKDKVKEETQRLYEEFCSKYPQYVENKKIKFPIEDTLLTIYDKTFIESQTLPKRPYPSQSKIIPQEHMNDILMIWNFLNSFSEHLENMKFTKEQIYIALDHKGEESHSMLSHIFKNLVRFPVLDIYYTHKIDNHKELSDQPFFILTRVAKELEQLDTIMHHIWPEFIRHLSFFQQYSINFKDDEVLAQIIDTMKKSDFSSFYDLDTSQRIKFMCLLIACVDDSDSFHDGVIGFKQEQVHEMTKERNDLQIEIKKEEGEFQAIDAQVKALELAQKDSSSAAILDSLSRAESLKKQKELEKEKKDLQKLKNQANKIEQSLNKKKNKCQQLTYDLPHYINTAQLLGYDHNKSEFWFYHNDRKTIYLRYKESLIDEDRVWSFYNTKEDITGLIKSLNKKGIREKNLYDNLMYLVKNGYLSYKFEDFDKRPSNNNSSANAGNNNQQQKDSSGIQTTLSFNNKNGVTPTIQNGESNNNGSEKKEMEIEDNKKQENSEDNKDEQLQNELEQNQMEEENAIEETKENILQFIINYDSSSNNKNAATATKKKNSKGSQQNEKELSIFQRTKCTFEDVSALILETEKNFTDYLEKRKSRWGNKNVRETFRERVRKTKDPQEILSLLEQLSEGFSAVDHMYIKENAKIQENEEESSKMEQEENDDENQSACSDDESFQGVQKKNGKNAQPAGQQAADKIKYTLEYFENHPQMRSKKLPMRIWGIYSEKCKKNWQNLPMVNVMSAYLSAYIFCTIIQKFLLRKKEQQEQLQNEQNQNAYYTMHEDKKNGNSNAATSQSQLNNQKRKLLSYNELESFKYQNNNDSSLRRSDRQRYRKDLTEPTYDLEDFEEEEGQEEESHDKRRNNKYNDDDDDDDEEVYNKSKKNNSKGIKSSKKNQDDYEDEYDADKIEDEDDIDEDSEDNQSDDHDEIDSNDDEDENQNNKKKQQQQQSKNKNIVKSNGKRKLQKQSLIKKKNNKNDEDDFDQSQSNQQNDNDEDDDEEDQENIKKNDKSKKKANNNNNNNNTKKQQKNISDDNDDEEEDEFQFYKDKKKDDKKPQYKDVSDDDLDNDNEDDEEEELQNNKNKSKNTNNNKNIKSQNKSKNNNNNQQQQEWDEQCKVCSLHGEVLMCDTCPSVFHLKCIGLKSLPEGDWNCLECQQKMLKQRQTRSAAAKKKHN